MHSPSRVQIPPSPLPAPGFHWNPGVSCVPVPPARVRAPGSVRVWGYRTKRVGFVAIFRLSGAGKSTLKLVVSSWGYEYPQMPGVRANDWPGTDTRRQLGSSPRRASYLRSSPRAWARSFARGPYCHGSSLLRLGAGPLMRAWARHLARGTDDMRVGSAAHAHVQRFTCTPRG